jgi:ATP-dependent RNA helicase DHX29
MAKKKKPAGNPARGFATTSVASKPKPEKQTNNVVSKNNDVQELTKGSLPGSESAVNNQPSTTEPLKPEITQTPEELEAQLERDELQLLVEKHAPKVRREANRHVTRFYTDRRVIRGQAHSMPVHEWLPNEILDEIISLAQNESNDSNRRRGQQSLLKVLNEEEAISRLWTLDLTLRDLGFSQSHTQPVLRWLCANASSVDASASVWGLQEALEWLALDQCEGHSFTYESSTIKRATLEASDSSRPGTFKSIHECPMLVNPMCHA